MPQWLNKCSEFEHMSRADENGIRANDWGKPNTAERLGESTCAVSVSFVWDFEQISRRT